MRFHFRHTPARLLALVFCTLALCRSLRAEEEKQPDTNVAVSVAKVMRMTLHAYVTGYGTVEPSPVSGADQTAGGAKLAAAASGLIVAVPVVEGARVEKGAVIVQLDARAADAAIAHAQAAITSAEKAQARQAQLNAANGTSERAMQEAEEHLAAARSELATAQFQQSQLAVRAPLAGILVRLQARPGEWLDAGKEVAEVVDLDRLIVTAQLPAQNAAAVGVAQPVKIVARLGVDGAPLAEGRVGFVSPHISADNDSVLVRVSVPAASGLHPGQFVAVLIASEEKSGVLAVPVESLVKDPEVGYVVCVVEKEVAKQVPVQPGLRDAGWVEVSGPGLAEGAAVVTAGAYGLPKETKVTVRQL